MHKIIILDLGSPEAQMLARNIRSAHVYCEVWSAHTPAQRLRQLTADGQLKGIVISGNGRLDEQDLAQLSSVVFTLDLPVLALGSGMLAMAQKLGGCLQTHSEPQIQTQVVSLRARGHTALLDGIADFTTKDGHGMLQMAMPAQTHYVSQMPVGFKLMASDPHGNILGMANEEKQLYGLQCQLSSPDTLQGQAILWRFLSRICQLEATWVVSRQVDEKIAWIRQQVGSERVLLGLSGGVDSSVSAALIHQAIGDQLVCVFVDHGLLRLHEADAVMTNLTRKLGVKVIHVDASQQFLKQLEGVTDPEQKRKIIGHEFVEVFKAEAAKLMEQGDAKHQVRFLAQGTIYPDVIESGGDKKTATIKSHHNVGGLPEQLGLELLEPLRDLFKDEVRELGRALGLPPEMVDRHPFPGPGLGVRILGAVKKHHADMLRQADAIFIEELRNTHDQVSGKSWYELTSQAFAVFLPVRSVGVSNGQRTYEHVVALRAIQTIDFMNAQSAELPWELLKKTSQRIIQEVPGINRVTYDISSKPPATIEWE